MNVPLFVFLSLFSRQKRLYTKATQRGALIAKEHHHHHHHRAFFLLLLPNVEKKKKKKKKKKKTTSPRFCEYRAVYIPRFRERLVYHWIFEIPFFSALLDFEIAFESTNHLSLSLSTSNREQRFGRRFI